MQHLFEYGEWINLKDPDGFRRFLQAIWEERSTLFLKDEDETEENKSKYYQPFFHFNGPLIRARNFVGFVQYDNELVEVYPKTFRTSNCADKSIMLQHIFYWLSYCRKWRFPFTKVGLDKRNIDRFPELIIYLIADQFHSVVSSQPLMQYEKVEEALRTPRGRINFNRYINNGLTKGNFHLIDCDYEPLVYDNRVNRIIKYCTRLLLQQTKLSENIRVLQEILFILDEVNDIPCTSHDLDSILLNSFHYEYVLVLESCRLILKQQLYSHNLYNLSQWCLLLPMEYVFEDFVAGFLQDYFSSEWHVEYQKSNMNFSSDPEAFQMNHDILLTSKKDPSKKIIVDTKYKVRDLKFKQDKKKGISQSDMYQVASYGFRRGCKNVLLLYPNISEEISLQDRFTIHSQFPIANSIHVTAAEIPFWSLERFNSLSERLLHFFSEQLRKYE
jgi:5-methylcytosine-specific restriction enzyme subunit McrC